jgi:SAM-dependent methyltransferase
MLRLLYRRVLHAIDNHGLRGTILRVVRRRPSGSHIEPEPSRPEVTVHPFDLKYGTDTGGYVPGESLSTGSSADLYNTAYYGISPSTLTQAIATVPIDCSQYTFVDLGCGKGRALLIAAQQRFLKVVGVELSPALAETAQVNTRTHSTIDVRIGDAATFLYPAGPLVVFFYHPFLAPLLRKVLANLVRQASGREIYILCANGRYPGVFQRFPTLQKQWEYDFTLSDEDAAADRHGSTAEHYALWRILQSH